MTTRYDERQDIGFFSAFLGLVISPGETSEILLSMAKPKFGLGILITLILTFAVPIWLLLYYENQLLYQPKAITALFLVMVIWMLLFVLLEGLMLRLIGIKINLGTLTSMTCYCLPPLIFTIWIMYALNYISSGNISFLSVILLGHAATDHRFVRYLPWITFMAQLLVGWAFYSSMKYVGQMYFGNALIITIFSLVPLYTALLGAVFFSDVLIPGTMNTFLEILTMPSSIMNV